MVLNSKQFPSISFTTQDHLRRQSLHGTFCSTHQQVAITCH